MNNRDLRTLAQHNIWLRDEAKRPRAGVSDTTYELAKGVLRLHKEVKRLSDLLAEEILEGSTELAADIRELDVPGPASDVPEGFQEVDVDDLLSNPE